MPKLKPHGLLLCIVIGGFLLRCFNYLFFAKYFFGTNHFMVNGDSTEYIAAITNLINHGSYTIDFGDARGYFARSPAYPFFIGLFYLLCGKNLALLTTILPWVQIVLDTISILLIYQITKNIANRRSALIASLLYAAYPFTIIWNPVIGTETFTVFLALLSLFTLSRAGKNLHYFLAGITLALVSFARMQMILILPAVLLAILLTRKQKWKTHILLIVIGFCTMYSPWVIRNYFYHGVIKPTITTWSKFYDDDLISLLKYSSTVQVDANSQVMQIILKQPVQWPPASFALASDSAELKEVTQLCEECGSSFQAFRRKEELEGNCDREIAQRFEELAMHQRAENSFHSNVILPLLRLQKAFFKTGTKERTGINPALDVLFYYRSLLILLGLISSILLIRKRKEGREIQYTVLLHFIFVYLFFGFFYYNLEMRYLLYADVLLLIPLAIQIESWLFRQSANQHITPNPYLVYTCKSCYCPCQPHTPPF